MGREIRRVPKGWEHPRYTEGPRAGQYMPLYDKDFETAAGEWKDEFLKWEAGERPDYCTDESRDLQYWEWDGGPPDRAYYRPKWTEAPTCYQVYQTVSEGTPVSPVFETLEELVQWLVDQGHSERAAQEFVKGGWAPSAVTFDGKFATGIDSFDLKPEPT